MGWGVKGNQLGTLWLQRMTFRAIAQKPFNSEQSASMNRA